MAVNTDLDRHKSTKSAKSYASNESTLKRWKSFIKPFAEQDSCDHCGRGSCDNGFEGRWDNGVPSVRPRTASKTGYEGWPRALSDAPSTHPRVHHKRRASSQAISPNDGFRVTYGMHTDRSEDDAWTSTRPSESRGSQMQSLDAVANGEEVIDDMDDDAMGLAQQRRSKRYSEKSPLSPTFNLGYRDRKSNDRLNKSILKRESIRLSALPPMPQGSRRSFPAGHGLASMISSPQKSPSIKDRFVFPNPPGSDGSPSTPRLITWTGLLDPENPQNRPVPAKLISTLLLLGLTLTVTFTQAVLTPASYRISQRFDTSSEVIILASALTVLGFAFGAPVFGAASERYGHKRPLLVGLAVFAVFNVPIGLTRDLSTLLAFRFFSGVFGAAPLVIVPVALTDLWSPVGRGVALSFFAAVSVIGPVVGAVAGSFLAVVEFPGWRWTAWIGILLSGFFGLPFALIYSESSAAIVLKRRAQKLRLVTKDFSLHAPIEERAAGFKISMIKMALMLGEPSLILPTLHMAFACGVLSRCLCLLLAAFADTSTDLMFVSYGFAFRTERHWLRGAQDLPLLPMIAGCLIGVFINFMVSKKQHIAVFRRDGYAAPESRVIREYPLLFFKATLTDGDFSAWIIGSWILPIGLIVFAWTSAPEITWIPQLMAGVPTGIGEAFSDHGEIDSS